MHETKGFGVNHSLDFTKNELKKNRNYDMHANLMKMRSNRYGTVIKGPFDEPGATNQMLLNELTGITPKMDGVLETEKLNIEKYSTNKKKK